MEKKNRKKSNLSNKEPTKDISKDDIKNKIPLATSKKLKKVKISNDIVFGSNQIPIIAGPNGVENFELMVKVAKQLKKNKIKIIRGHAYKPLLFHTDLKCIKKANHQGWILWMKLKTILI